MIKFVKYTGTKGNYRELRSGDSVWLNGIERKVKSVKILPEALIIGVEGRKLRFSNISADFPIQLADESVPVIKKNCNDLISLEDLKRNYDYDGVVRLLHKVFLRTIEIVDRASLEYIEFIRNSDPYALWGPGIKSYIYEKTGIKRIN